MVTCSPERTTPRVSPGLYVAVRISVGYGIAARAASSFSFPFIGCVLNIKADEINKNGLWWAGCTYTMAETRYCQWMHFTGNVTGQLCGLQSFLLFEGELFLLTDCSLRGAYCPFWTAETAERGMTKGFFYIRETVMFAVWSKTNKGAHLILYLITHLIWCVLAYPVCSVQIHDLGENQPGGSRLWVGGTTASRARRTWRSLTLSINQLRSKSGQIIRWKAAFLLAHTA